MLVISAGLMMGEVMWWYNNTTSRFCPGGTENSGLLKIFNTFNILHFKHNLTSFPSLNRHRCWFEVRRRWDSIHLREMRHNKHWGDIQLGNKVSVCHKERIEIWSQHRLGGKYQLIWHDSIPWNLMPFDVMVFGFRPWEFSKQFCTLSGRSFHFENNHQIL